MANNRISASRPCHSARLSRKCLIMGFRSTATCGLLIGIITVFWQIHWHVEWSDVVVNWSFELEICFGIYGLFLASTSYYLTQLQATSWAQFHVAVSAIGILLDLILFGYHVHLIQIYGSISQTKKRPGLGNDHFMISVAMVQAANNLVTIYLSLQIPEEFEPRLLEKEGTYDTDETSTSLLKPSPAPLNDGFA